MIDYDIARARKAVQFLVDSPYSANHVRKLRTAVLKPRAMPFKGEAEVLNELLIVGRQSLQAMENLIEIAEFKRDDRTEYQRQFMAAKRQRDRKVIQLEEKLSGRPLKVDERVTVLHKQYDIWNAEKTIMLSTLDGCTWAEKNLAIRSFWERKEAELDELMAEAGKLANKVVHRKKTVHVAPAKETTLGVKLREAIGKKPAKRVHVDKRR